MTDHLQVIYANENVFDQFSDAGLSVRSSKLDVGRRADVIGEDALKQSLQCSMRPDVGIANDYRCDADITMKVVRLGIVERSCIITSRQSSQLLMHLLLLPGSLVKSEE